MTQQYIDLGDGANSGTGDSVRDSFRKVNENFEELYGAVDPNTFSYRNLVTLINDNTQSFSQHLINLNTNYPLSRSQYNRVIELISNTATILRQEFAAISLSTDDLYHEIYILNLNTQTLKQSIINLGTAFNSSLTNVVNYFNGEISVLNLNTQTLKQSIINLGTAFNSSLTNVVNYFNGEISVLNLNTQTLKQDIINLGTAFNSSLTNAVSTLNQSIINQGTAFNSSLTNAVNTINQSIRTYEVSAETATGGANLRLTGTNSNNSITDDVKFSAGTGISISRTDANTITITNTIADTDTNTTYSVSAETATGGANLRLTGSDASTDNVKFAAGTGISISRTDADTITITNTIADTDTNTTYSVSAEAVSGGANLRLTGSDASTDDVKIASGTGITVSRTDANTINIATTVVDTNTTYSQSAVSTTGGANLRLSGSDSTNDDVKIASGTGITVTATDANTINIATTIVDTNTTYSVSAETATGGANLRLTGSDSSTDNVKIASGTGITVSRTDADTITISNTVADTNTTYGISAETVSGGANLRLSGSDSSADDVKIASGSGITVSRTDANTINIATTIVDTNTTYGISAETVSGGANLRLTGNDSSTDDVKIASGTNVTVTRTDANTITISSSAPIDSLYDAGTGSGALTFDRNNGTIQKFTLNGNATSLAISNMTTAQSFTIILTQDGSGNRTLTTSGSFKFASGYKTLSTTGGAIDMLNIFYDGTTYYCTLTTGYT